MTTAAFDVPFELAWRAAEDPLPDFAEDPLPDELLRDPLARDEPLRDEPLRDEPLFDEPLREDALRDEPLREDALPEDLLRDDALPLRDALLFGLDPFELRLFERLELLRFVPEPVLAWAMPPP